MYLSKTIPKHTTPKTIPKPYHNIPNQAYKFSVYTQYTLYACQILNVHNCMTEVHNSAADPNMMLQYIVRNVSLEKFYKWYHTS